RAVGLLLLGNVFELIAIDFQGDLAGGECVKIQCGAAAAAEDAGQAGVTRRGWVAVTGGGDAVAAQVSGIGEVVDRDRSRMDRGGSQSECDTSRGRQSDGAKHVCLLDRVRGRKRPPTRLSSKCRVKPVPPSSTMIGEVRPPSGCRLPC